MTPILQSEDWTFPISGRRLFLVEDGSGNLRANVVPREAELAEFYARHFDRATYVRRGKMWQGWHRAWRCRELLRSAPFPRILDFGCGNGQFLRACRNFASRGKLAGFEMSAAQCRLASRTSDATTFSDWNALVSENPQGFDVITAWHVIEHVPDPATIIRRLYGVLKPGGTCVLAVPNRSAWGLRLRGEKWAWCQAPFIHIWHFSARGMATLIRQNLPDAEILIGTRDSWDCNFLIDGAIAGSRVFNWIQPPRVRLTLESGLRLLAAAMNEAVLNPAVFSWSSSGSELIVQLRKPRDA